MPTYFHDEAQEPDFFSITQTLHITFLWEPIYTSLKKKNEKDKKNPVSFAVKSSKLWDKKSKVWDHSHYVSHSFKFSSQNLNFIS